MDVARPSSLGSAEAALLRPDPRIGLPLPAYAGRSIPNVARTAVDAADVALRDAEELLPPLVADLDPFGGRRAEGTVVLFLVDALGWTSSGDGSLGDRPGYPSSWRERARPITTVFPTTTAVALTSLSTGQSPSRHGVVGHRVFLPRFGAVTEMLRMSPVGVGAFDAFAGPEWSPSLVSGAPSWFRRGVRAVALSRDRFEGSGFTRLLYEGAEYVGYSTAADFGHRLGEVLSRPTPPPLVFAYWDELDAVQHVHGPLPSFLQFESDQVARILRQAVRRLDPGRARRTTVLLTSDHGQVPIDLASEISLEREPSIAPTLRQPPGGDRRALLLTARPGQLGALREALAQRLPPGHRVLSASTAVDAGLFGPGPFHPELFDRLGDLLVLVPSPASLTYRVPGSPPRPLRWGGAHGGLEPEELLVPLVAGPITELGRPDPA